MDPQTNKPIFSDEQGELAKLASSAALLAALRSGIEMRENAKNQQKKAASVVPPPPPPPPTEAIGALNNPIIQQQQPQKKTTIVVQIPMAAALFNCATLPLVIVHLLVLTVLVCILVTDPEALLDKQPSKYILMTFTQERRLLIIALSVLIGLESLQLLSLLFSFYCCQCSPRASVLLLKNATNLARVKVTLSLMAYIAWILLLAENLFMFLWDSPKSIGNLQDFTWLMVLVEFVFNYGLLRGCIKGAKKAVNKERESPKEETIFSV